jgi:proteic killer suppression protein
VITIDIEYKNKKREKLCTDAKYAIKQLGSQVSKKLFQRIRELQAFECLGDVPSNLPYRREKLKGKVNLWSIRIDDAYRLIISPIDFNNDIRKIKIIEIEEVSNHYE